MSVDAWLGGVYSEPRGTSWPPKSAPSPIFLMNLPNSLTLLRIFFVPLLIVVLLTRSPNVELWGVSMRFEFWGVLILLIAAATDWADGYLARRNSQITTLGILLDPIADKLLISAAFISLVDMHLVPAWMVVIIIGREFTIMGLRNIASAEGFTIAASTLGKTKMVLQVCAAAVLIGGVHRPRWSRWAAFCCGWWSSARWFPRDNISTGSGVIWTTASSNDASWTYSKSRKKPQDAVPL